MIFKEFKEKEKKMFKFCNGKKVYLWGYGYSGRFCEHLFKRANKVIEYIIDDSANIDSKIDIERSIIIKELDKDTHVILLAFKRENKAVSFLTSLGFEENKNFIFINELFYDTDTEYRKLSYYDWLQYKYKLDITKFKFIDEIERPNTDCLYYSPGIDYSIVDILDNFEFDNTDAVFDFGCGKAEILIMFYAMGVRNIGGVEYDKELYNISVSNLNKVKIDTINVLNDNAIMITDVLDEFNYFFMYNPFQGKTFESVINNMEESYRRRKRKMFFIYSGPYCHDMVIHNGIFKFSKTIKTDYSVKNVRIYCTN